MKSYQSVEETEKYSERRGRRMTVSLLRCICAIRTTLFQTKTHKELGTIIIGEIRVNKKNWGGEHDDRESPRSKRSA